MTADESRRLARAWREQHDRSARDQLILGHMRLAEWIAVTMQRPGETLDDLVQTAYEGLVQATDHYDPAGASFVTFATYWVRGTIGHYYRDHAYLVRVPRRVQAHAVAMARCEDRLTREKGRTPTRTEIGVAAQLGPREIDDVARAWQRPVSLESPRQPTRCATWFRKEPTTAEDVMADPWGEDRLSGIEDCDIVRRLLIFLPAGEVQLVWWRMRGVRQRTIAERLGISQRRVSRLQAKVFRHLRAIAVAQAALN
jgi:RNA polymerase sigma-B factor